MSRILSNILSLVSLSHIYLKIGYLVPISRRLYIEDYILKFLKNINEDKAAGIDNLSGKFLKDGAAVLAKPISQICNLSIKYSHFPTDRKIAKLKPFFKKGSRTVPKNYRPISLLPLISKIIEKVIHDQTQKYVDDYNIQY